MDRSDTVNGFDYEVVIAGMEQVPLRTTKEGAKSLITAFDNGEKAANILVGAMKEGIEFVSDLVKVKIPQPPVAPDQEKKSVRKRSKSTRLQTRKPTRRKKGK